MDITKADVNNFLGLVFVATLGLSGAYIAFKLVKASFWGTTSSDRSDARWLLAIIVACVAIVIAYAWYMSLPAARSVQ